MAGRDSPKRKKLTVRMPSSLKQKLEEAASASGRSVNAEIVHRLIRSLEAYRR